MQDVVTKTTTAESVVKETPNGKDEGEYLKVPISSTGEDRDGDSFSEEGLKDQKEQIQETSRSVFSDHGGGGGLFGGVRYPWKGIIGSQDDAEILDDPDRDEKTLYSYINPNSEHPDGDGELLASYVKQGMPVGFSIGFRPLDYDGDEDEGYEFHKSDLMETSAVGIQSNQEAVAGRGATDTAAMLAKGAAGGVPGQDFDEETFARVFVSELSAAGAIPDGEQRGAGDFSETEPAERRDHNMGDTPADDTDEEYLTRSDAEEMFEKYLGDGDPEDDEPEEKGETDDLRTKVDDLDTSIEELKEKVDESDPEESETSTAEEPDDEDGTNDETAGDNEDATEEPDDEDKSVSGEEVVM